MHLILGRWINYNVHNFLWAIESKTCLKVTETHLNIKWFDYIDSVLFGLKPLRGGISACFIEFIAHHLTLGQHEGSVIII